MWYFLPKPRFTRVIFISIESYLYSSLSDMASPLALLIGSTIDLGWYVTRQICASHICGCNQKVDSLNPWQKSSMCLGPLRKAMNRLKCSRDAGWMTDLVLWPQASLSTVCVCLKGEKDMQKLMNSITPFVIATVPVLTWSIFHLLILFIRMCKSVTFNVL